MALFTSPASPRSSSRPVPLPAQQHRPRPIFPACQHRRGRSVRPRPVCLSGLPAPQPHQPSCPWPPSTTEPPAPRPPPRTAAPFAPRPPPLPWPPSTAAPSAPRSPLSTAASSTPHPPPLSPRTAAPPVLRLPPRTTTLSAPRPPPLPASTSAVSDSLFLQEPRTACLWSEQGLHSGVSTAPRGAGMAPLRWRSLGSGWCTAVSCGLG